VAEDKIKRRFKQCARGRWCLLWRRNARTEASEEVTRLAALASKADLPECIKDDTSVRFLQIAVNCHF
jgi:hypothetical protein